MIKLEQVLPSVPHRPPMVWMDNLVEYNSVGGITESILKADRFYFSNGRFRPTSFLEMMAQSFAMVRIADIMSRGDSATLKRAFLASIKNFKFDAEATHALKPGDSVFIIVRQTNEMSGLRMIKGTAENSERKVLATVQLNLFGDL